MTFWNLLLMTNEELAEAGMPRNEITACRQRFTGHERPLSTKWASSIGLWGRITSQAEIAEALGVPSAQVKSYKNKWDLRTATEQLRRSPWEIAAGLFFERYLPGDAARRRWGVLPVEAVLYRSSLQEVFTQHGVTPAQAVRWSPHELAEAWVATDVGVDPPEDLQRTRGRPTVL
ncbi:MAG: hypothetical protein JJ863_17500 [Deltaproteobacteria bacterium]|nr:hypothetical protein [Deltaproteobacteria bacterium]